MSSPPHRRLFAPGERVGWIFRDRWQFVRPFPDPAPHPPVVSNEVLDHHDDLQADMRRQVTLALVIGFGVSLLIGGPFVVFTVMSDGDLVIATGLAVAPALLGVLGALLALGRRVSSREAVREHHSGVLEAYAHARNEWARRRHAYEAREYAEVDGLDEWGAATIPPGVRRFDVFGGTLWSWEGLLTIFGASMLVERRPVTVLDLSREEVCTELVGLATGAGQDVLLHRLPDDLAGCDLLAGLDTTQLIDSLSEAMHRGTATDRAERSMDHRILAEVCRALGDDVSIARIVAALRVLMRESDDSGVLTHTERDRIADDLFSDDYRRDAQPNLRRLESYLYPLRTLGLRRASRRADLTCLTLRPGGRTASSELLTDLVVQWLVNRVTDRAHPPGGVVILVGADDLPAAHLDRLADACDRRQVRLVTVFRHLREEALQAIGGGAVGFMRLGNHEEAAAAADFVGREHRFVVSQLTRGLSGGHSRSEGDSVSRDWTRTVQVADQSGWNEAESTQRVYEYRVEPRTFQGLPDYALVLVEHTPGGPSVRAVECDPGLAALPRVSTDPLPVSPREPLAVESGERSLWRSRGPMATPSTVDGG